jgi:hypothetical protein
MGVCRGNLGNLMQHWVLCEVLDQLSKEDYRHLLQICTHSMAPWSVPEPIGYSKVHSPRLHRRRYFDEVRRRLHGHSTSLYERSWRTLSSHFGLPYPSSALFSCDVWPRKISLLLCEAEPFVAKEIESWFGLPEVEARLDQKMIRQGDWRVGLSQDAVSSFCPDVILAELDPMQFEHRNPASEQARNGALLYPDDMDRLVAVFQNVVTPTVLQVSSYDVNHDNSLTVVEPAIAGPLQAAGFALAAKIKPNEQMISLVYCRGLTIWQSPNILNQRFTNWLSR